MGCRCEELEQSAASIEGCARERNVRHKRYAAFHFDERDPMVKEKSMVLLSGALLMALAYAPDGLAANGGLAGSMGLNYSGAKGGQRFLIKYRAGAVELRDAAAADRSMNTAAISSGVTRSMTATSISPARQAATVRLLHRMGVPRWSVARASRVLDAEQAEAFMRELRANPSVEKVEIDGISVRYAMATATAAPNDPDYARLQWNLAAGKGGVDAPKAWERSQGEGVVVAVVDTGVAAGNPDLQANVLPGYDMITDKEFSRRNEDGRVPGGWDVGDWAETNRCIQYGADPHPAHPSSWHGTHVSGTIAQETNNGIGLAGLAYKAKVLPVRVLGSCGGINSDVADGIVWAAGGNIDGLPLNTNPAEVINLSLGGDNGCPSVFQEAIDFAISRGAIVVAAAGNSGDDADEHAMGACNNLILVAASNSDGKGSYFSSHGTRVALMAPGGNEAGLGSASKVSNNFIWQMINGGATRPEPGNWKMEGYSGTSMAAPHVSAAIALVQSMAVTPLTTDQVRNLLMRTSTSATFSIGEGWPDRPSKKAGLGAGILNVGVALDELFDPHCSFDKEVCFDPPVVPLVPTVLDNKVELKDLKLEQDKEALYSFEAEAGKVLSFMTYGGSGAASMYVSYGKEPTKDTAELRSIRPGTTIQTVRLTVPKKGTYYVKLVAEGYFGYGRMTLVARQ